ncbi:MAG: Insertion element protein [Syntrophaceae bacterium]|nr:Insertion element protein [Syntrophaceae bacterium]
MIRCPRCNSEATNRYGKSRSGTPRLICLQCNRQFTIGKRPLPIPQRPQCPKCGNKMHLYRRQFGVIRFRCSAYPACRGYHRLPTHPKEEESEPLHPPDSWKVKDQKPNSQEREISPRSPGASFHLKGC